MDTTTNVSVQGMTCGHCVSAVTSELSKIANVRSVNVVLETGVATLQSDGPVDPAAIEAAVDEAGYEVLRS